MVVTIDGHVYKLDTRGSAGAVAALKATSRASGLKVTVTGTDTDGTSAVASLALEKQATAGTTPDVTGHLRRLGRVG